jgi:hypothetical protein
MPDQPKHEPKPRRRPCPPPRKLEEAETPEEFIREQAKTEVEERPYLDTEGGE